MALWEVNGEIVYSDGALSITPTGKGVTLARRFFYRIPYSNTGLGGFMMKKDKKFHVPSYIEVHPETDFNDLIVEKKPFEELFVEPKTWSFKSASSDKEYTVKLTKAGKLSCNCWGYMAHKKCKHVKEVQESLC